MSKVAEFFVQLGADVSQYSRGMKEADMINKEMMRSFKNLQKQIDSDYFLLAKGSQEFAMSQKDLEKKILELGAEHKKITDQMINSNDAFRASIFRQIGTVQNMTNQSKKLQETLTNYGGAIRKADVLTLKFGNHLENVAKQGQVALVALRMLGPQASNKELVDMIKTLNQGIVRYQSVAMAAGIATLFLAGALFKLAKASDPLLDDRLSKSAKLWLDALQPLGMAVSGLIRAFLALTDPIAKFLIQLKALDPALAAATAGFFALLIPLSLLLAPLATGATGLAAFRLAFASVFMLIKPFVLGFLSIAGTVAIVSAAIVTVAALFYKMWQNSELLRNSVLTLGKVLQTAFLSAWAIIQPPLAALGAAIGNLIQTVVGGSLRGQNAWQTLGNVTAQVFTFLANSVIPLLAAALQASAKIIAGVINLITGIINIFASNWNNKMNFIVLIVKNAFTNVVTIIKGAFQIIGQVFQFFANIINGNFRAALGNLLKIVEIIFTTVVSVIKNSATTAVNAFLSIFGRLPNQAGQVVRDVVSRVMSVGSSLYSAAKTMASNFWSGFKKGLGINSPSFVERAFMAMGDQALATQKTINNSVPQMTRALTSATRPIQPMAAAASGPQPIDMTRSGTGAGAGTIIIQNMQVRSDSDIVDISNRLYRLQQTQLRGRGVGGQIFAD